MGQFLLIMSTYPFSGKITFGGKRHISLDTSGAKTNYTLLERNSHNYENRSSSWIFFLEVKHDFSKFPT